MLPSQGSSESSITKQVIWGGGCTLTTPCNNAVEAMLQGVVKLHPDDLLSPPRIRPPLDSLRWLLRKDQMRSSLLESGYSQEIDCSIWKSMVGYSCI